MQEPNHESGYGTRPQDNDPEIVQPEQGGEVQNGDGAELNKTPAGPDYEALSANEAPEPMLPNARVLDRPEGRSERLRIA